MDSDPDGWVADAVRAVVEGYGRPREGSSEDNLGHQLIEYVNADGVPVLYLDTRELLAFGRFFGPGLSQDQLKDFFVTDGS